MNTMTITVNDRQTVAKAVLDRFQLRSANTMLFKWGVLLLMDDGGNGRVPQRVAVKNPTVFNAVRDALLGRKVEAFTFELDLSQTWPADPGLRLERGATQTLAILSKDKAESLNWLDQVFIEPEEIAS